MRAHADVRIRPTDLRGKASPHWVAAVGRHRETQDGEPEDYEERAHDVGILRSRRAKVIVRDQDRDANRDCDRSEHQEEASRQDSAPPPEPGLPSVGKEREHDCRDDEEANGRTPPRQSTPTPSPRAESV